MRAWKLYLSDILEAIESIESFVAGTTFDAFQADKKTISAVVRQFEVIGEAAKQIPDDIREAYPTIPWRDMARMRDFLIHAYFQVNSQRIWETVKTDLPSLKQEILKIIQQHPLDPDTSS